MIPLANAGGAALATLGIGGMIAAFVGGLMLAADASIRASERDDS